MYYPKTNRLSVYLDDAATRVNLESRKRKISWKVSLIAKTKKNKKTLMFTLFRVSAICGEGFCEPTIACTNAWLFENLCLISRSEKISHGSFELHSHFLLEINSFFQHAKNEVFTQCKQQQTQLLTKKNKFRRSPLRGPPTVAIWSKSWPSNFTFVFLIYLSLRNERFDLIRSLWNLFQ